MHRFDSFFLKRNRVSPGQFFFIIFLLSSLSLYALDFKNSEHNISFSYSGNWSRIDEMEKNINSCFFSIINMQTSANFNLIIVGDSFDGNYEELSEEDQQTQMEQTLVEMTTVSETDLEITMNKNYLKKVNGRYYGIFEYIMDGTYVIQAVAFYRETQYTFTMTAITDKPNDSFFEILNTIQYTN